MRQQAMPGFTENLHRFVPDSFTHLFHTDCYALLNETQRLKYNHLFGLRINEQFIMFEEVFIGRLMPRLKRHQILREHPQLLDDIEMILRDEEQHTRMFARFNRNSRPDLYSQGPERFTRLSWLEKVLFRMLMGMPGLLPGLLWLMLAMEELTTAISSELVNHPQCGGLDRDYVALHRQHLEDEKRHVGIDVKLVRMIQETMTVPTGMINASIFRTLLCNILKPRRSTLEVLRQLVQEETELKVVLPRMVNEVSVLQPRLAFPANLLTPETLPVLYRLAVQYPGYQLLNQKTSPLC